MSWADQAYKKYQKKLKAEEDAKLALKTLQSGEEYQALTEAIYEDQADNIERQVVTMMFACIRVALKEHGISDRKANAIMVDIDNYRNYGWNEYQYNEWCIEKTGMGIGGSISSEEW